MTDETGERPDLFAVGEAFLLGAVVPPGSLYALTTDPAAGVLEPAGDAVVVAWLAAIALVTFGAGTLRAVPTPALLGGALLGSLAGWLAYAWAVGVDVVVLALAFLAAVAIVPGAWAAYERRRRRGLAEEPPAGSWRYVFVGLLLVLSTPIVLLVG